MNDVRGKPDFSRCIGMLLIKPLLRDTEEIRDLL